MLFKKPFDRVIAVLAFENDYLHRGVEWRVTFKVVILNRRNCVVRLGEIKLIRRRIVSSREKYLFGNNETKLAHTRRNRTRERDNGYGSNSYITITIPL